MSGNAVESGIGDSFFSIDGFGLSIVSDFGVSFLSTIIHKPWSFAYNPLTTLVDVEYNSAEISLVFSFKGRARMHIQLCDALPEAHR